jgi:hypothetical protein
MLERIGAGLQACHMIAAKMGELPASELHAVEDKLRQVLAL